MHGHRWRSFSRNSVRPALCILHSLYIKHLSSISSPGEALKIRALVLITYYISDMFLSVEYHWTFMFLDLMTLSLLHIYIYIYVARWKRGKRILLYAQYAVVAPSGCGPELDSIPSWALYHWVISEGPQLLQHRVLPCNQSTGMVQSQ